MELNRRPLPYRLFWSSYRGMAVLSLAGAFFGLILGTAMLLGRHIIEPWMPLIINAALHLASRRMHGNIQYAPQAYLWIVGGVYALGALWVGIIAFAALLKPSSDRRIDAYLKRKQALDISYIRSRRPPPSSD